MGSASREIVQAAVDIHADLIVMGTHGRGGIASSAARQRCRTGHSPRAVCGHDRTIDRDSNRTGCGGGCAGSTGRLNATSHAWDVQVSAEHGRLAVRGGAKSWYQRELARELSTVNNNIIVAPFERVDAGYAAERPLFIRT
jgi:hypothetical protein